MTGRERSDLTNGEAATLSNKQSGLAGEERCSWQILFPMLPGQTCLGQTCREHVMAGLLMPGNCAVS